MAEKNVVPIFARPKLNTLSKIHRDWYRDPSLNPVYRIDCHEKCRQYWLEAISEPHPQIDPAIVAFLDSLNGEQRTFVSESTRQQRVTVVF